MALKHKICFYSTGFASVVDVVLIKKWVFSCRRFQDDVLSQPYLKRKKLLLKGFMYMCVYKKIIYGLKRSLGPVLHPCIRIYTYTRNCLYIFRHVCMYIDLIFCHIKYVVLKRLYLCFILILCEITSNVALRKTLYIRDLVIL